jgi:hypothetical protein
MFLVRPAACSVSVTPLGDRLWLKLPDAPDKVGSIWLPPQAQRDYTVCQAEVLERGPRVADWRLQPGARVIVRLFGKVALRDGWCIFERDVLALLDLSRDDSSQPTKRNGTHLRRTKKRR